jgi:hypothetical protein
MMTGEMRWRFPHLSEREARESVLGHIDAWWRTFAAAATRLDDFFKRREAWDLAGWMRAHLGVVDERIMWEFGPGTRDADGHRLILTPEGERHLRPLVDAILARAPALPGWEFHGHRLAERLPTALQTVAERTSVDLTSWTARAGVSDEGLVDVVFAPPEPGPASLERRAAALLLVESLLGEDLMDVWIGTVDVEDHRSAGASLASLAADIHELVETLRARVPELPYCGRAGDASWTLLRLAPKTNGAVDYPGQQDMLVAKTVDFTLWRAQHGGRPFHSRRFSRSGEIMTTLKIDGADGLAADGLADKAAIEDAITAALVPRGLGAQVGGGTGLRYSYVDLALTDVAAAMEALRPVLRAGKLPRRTWLQFFDAELSDEWLPLWDDAPAPPR